MITVVGLGFVGLTTAASFAEKGFRVYAHDTDRVRADQIRRKKLPFHEPGLDVMLDKHVGRNLVVVDSQTEAVRNSRIIFYCVGTPCGDDGRAELSSLLAAIRATLTAVPGGDYKVLVVKSTVPPGSTRDVVKPFVESLGFEVGRELGLVNNPEFLREGHALDDFMNPDRIVIGENDRRAGEVLEEIYQPFSAPILHVSWNTGEFIKYLSNALLSTLISFSNEMSQIADAIGGIEIAQAFRILHQDRRWSGQPANMSTYVYPGCGFGGYCLPKDTRALCAQAEAKGYTPALIGEVLRTNSRIKQFVAGKVLQAATDGDYVGVLGLSFKPESDDVRSSPAEDIVRILLEKGHKKIIAYDPLGMENFRSAYALPIEYAASVEEVVKRARLLVILTAWREFVDKREFLATRRVLDFRYVLS